MFSLIYLFATCLLQVLLLFAHLILLTFAELTCSHHPLSTFVSRPDFSVCQRPSFGWGHQAFSRFVITPVLY